MNRLGAEAALQLVDVHRADTAGQHPCCAYRYNEFDAVRLLMQKAIDDAACFSLKDLAVNGNDLISMGLHGKQVGSTLQMLLNAVMDGTVPNAHSALLEFASRHGNTDTSTEP